MTHLNSRNELALNWLLRLPLLGSYELSMLMDIDEEDARRLLLDLNHADWLAADTASSPELESDRLYALSPAALAEITRALQESQTTTECGLALQQQEIEDRWSRVEATVGLNRFIAELVLAVRSTVNLRLEGLRVLPQGKRPAAAWWPPGVDAFGALQARGLQAPFFIAWDRAAVPRVHRTRRLGAWNAYFRAVGHCWSYRPPTVLIVCPNSMAGEQWAQAAQNAEERSSTESAPLAIAEIAAVFSADPLDALWRSANASAEQSLTERLSWRADLPESCELTPLPKLPDSPREALQVAVRRPFSLYRELGAAQKRVLEWVAFHPLLTVDDLSVLLRCRYHQAKIIASRLQETGFVDCVQRKAEADPHEDAYYFLTGAGLQAMAFRDGVPAPRYTRFGSVASTFGGEGAGRLQTLLRQFEHTIGTNRFFVRLIAESTGHSAQVVSWLSAADSAVLIPRKERLWLRPDGSSDLKLNGVIYRLLLEYDRGTMRGPQMDEKLAHYASYFHSDRRSESSTLKEKLLVVTTTPSREQKLTDMLLGLKNSQALAAHFFTTTNDLVQRLGPFSAIWRSAGTGERRLLS